MDDEPTDGSIEADNVVIATGPYQEPIVPATSRALPSRVRQVHSSGYRNPGQLPAGAVLVVGSGASGCQIVEDLLAAVDRDPQDDAHLVQAELAARLAERDRLVASLAAGVPAVSIAPLLQTLERDVRRLEARLAPRPVRPNRETLRATLTQRIADWQEKLRGEVALARIVLQRLIGPILLHEPPLPVLARPGFWMLAAGAVEMLPDHARELLDLHLPGPLRVLDGVALRTVASPLGRLGTAAVGWALADPRDPRNSPASSQVRASPSA